MNSVAGRAAGFAVRTTFVLPLLSASDEDVLRQVRIGGNPVSTLLKMNLGFLDSVRYLKIILYVDGVVPSADEVRYAALKPAFLSAISEISLTDDQQRAITDIIPDYFEKYTLTDHMPKS